MSLAATITAVLVGLIVVGVVLRLARRQRDYRAGAEDPLAGLTAASRDGLAACMRCERRISRVRRLNRKRPAVARSRAS